MWSRDTISIALITDLLDLYSIVLSYLLQKAKLLKLLNLFRT